MSWPRTGQRKPRTRTEKRTKWLKWLCLGPNRPEGVQRPKERSQVSERWETERGISCRRPSDLPNRDRSRPVSCSCPRYRYRPSPSSAPSPSFSSLGRCAPACPPAMLPHTLWSLLLLSVFSSFVRAQGPVQTLFPASMPLAVKHPYMSVWYKSVNNAAPLSDSWPYFWGQQVSIPVNILRSLQLAIADGAVGYGLGRQD